MNAMHNGSRNARRVVTALGSALLLASVANASGPKTPPATHAGWLRECGSCHVAYPPRLLPAASWGAIMDRLGDHFGTDASIDEPAAAAIRAFLQANAGRDRETRGAPVLQITKTRWFLHEHDQVSQAAWRSPQVASPANCGACHRGAANGRFDEHDVRVPGN
jgi:cytochrome c553